MISTDLTHIRHVLSKSKSFLLLRERKREYQNLSKSIGGAPLKLKIIDKQHSGLIRLQIEVNTKGYAVKCFIRGWPTYCEKILFSINFYRYI